LECTHGVGLPFFAHRRRAQGEVFAWDRIDCGVTREHLEVQLAASRAATELEDCVAGPCSNCGACDQEVVKNRVHVREGYVAEPPGPPKPGEPPTRTHVRVRYAKR